MADNERRCVHCDRIIDESVGYREYSSEYAPDGVTDCNGDTVCMYCLDSYRVCDVCGEWVPESAVAFYGDSECEELTVICSSCCHKGWSACDRCGRIERNGEWHDVRDKYNDDLSVCADCADEIRKHGY